MFDEDSELLAFLRRYRILFQIAAGVIAIELILLAYSGVWPPLYVVRSNSMQHSETASALGIIDTGDLVLIESTNWNSVSTYVESFSEGHRSFGDYGDVIVYERYGLSSLTPLAHRAMVHVDYNVSSDAFDIPSLLMLPSEKWSNVGLEQGRWWALDGVVEIYDVGYRSATLRLNLTSLVEYYRQNGLVHDGLITMGDNNLVLEGGQWICQYDQITAYCREPVMDEWIRGEASLEIPWLGLIRLYVNAELPDYAPNNSKIALIVTMATLLGALLASRAAFNYMEDRGIRPWKAVRERLMGMVRRGR